MCAIKLCALRIDHWPRTAIRTNTHVSHIGEDCMRRNESLCLGGNRSEDTFLLEALAIGAASLWVFSKA